METYVARQPIFDKQQNVFAYELLHRSGLYNSFLNSDGDQATSELITNSLLVIGFSTLTRGKMAFVNFTKNLLEQDIATILPPQFTVIEILEDIEPDESLLRACKKLKNMGYLLALDDFVYHEKYKLLIELADIIKIDFLSIGITERSDIIKRIGNQRIKFLAEKIETKDDFMQALQMGYSYFQGYFFSKPIILSGKDIPAHKLTYFQILQEINKPIFSFDAIEKLIKTDVSLSYKLLKFINSSSFGFRTQIHSLNQALILLGKNGIIKWLSLVALKSLGEDKPSELFVTAICRGNLCELLANKVCLHNRSSDLFLMGMLSLIDAFLDQPLESILAELPIPQDVKDALLGESSKLRDIYETAVSYEQGQWQKLVNTASKLNLEVKDMISIYLESIELTNRIIG